VTRYCSNCGEETAEDGKFCGNCGARLDEDDSQTDQWGEPASSEGEDAWYEDSEQMVIPRKDAFETLGQSAKWLLGFPVLFGAFLVVQILDIVARVANPLFALVNLVAGLLVGGIAYVYAENALRDEPAELGAALDRVVGQILSLIVILIIYAVVVGIGFVLLVLPGIYLGARLILAFPACVLDEQGAFDSLSTSWDVAGGVVLKLLAIFILSILPAVGIGVVVAVSGGSISTTESNVLLLATPIFAILSGIQELATARVYLENR
jgi:hypothetical protein